MKTLPTNYIVWQTGLISHFSSFFISSVLLLVFRSKTLWVSCSPSLSFSLSKFLVSNLKTIFLSQSQFQALNLISQPNESLMQLLTASQYCSTSVTLKECFWFVTLVPVRYTLIGRISVFISVQSKGSRYGRYLNRYEITVFLYRSSHWNDKYRQHGTKFTPLTYIQGRLLYFTQFNIQFLKLSHTKIQIWLPTLVKTTHNLIN